MIVFGKQLFLHIMKFHKDKIQEVYLSKEFPKDQFSKIAGLGKKIIKIDNKKAQALAKGGNHQGYFAKIEPIAYADFSSLKNSNFLLMLYGLSDVGNIGAICRSAYAFGVDGLIISGVKSVNLEAILRTSSAAALELPICLMQDANSIINELRQIGFKAYATAANSKDVRQIQFGQKKLLILGSESLGIPAKIIQKCDESIGIRMAREFDSLNVSAAAAILCDRIANE